MLLHHGVLGGPPRRPRLLSGPALQLPRGALPLPHRALGGRCPRLSVSGARRAPHGRDAGAAAGRRGGHLQRDVPRGNAVGAVVFGHIAHWLGYRVMWSALTLIIIAGFVLSFRLRASPTGELVPVS